MNKLIETNLNNRTETTPIIHNTRTKHRTFEVRPLKQRRRQNNKVLVSRQDIRDLASTLYLKEIPGLCGLEDDRDILIDEYYVTGNITD